MEKKISCGEIWCGIHGNDIHVTTSGIEASLFSSACDGGKGGDIYYFSVCDSDLLSRIAIADVMGHGKAVAETSQWMCDSLKDKMNNVQGNEVLADLNAAAVDYGYKALTTAAAIGWYREQKKLFFSYAGHPPVFVRRTGDDHWWRLELPKSNHAANLPLGVGREFSFEQSAITLASGDALFFYTDGLLEAEDAQGQPFGNQQLPAVLNAHGTDPQIVKESVLSALGAFTGGGQWSHDDVTFGDPDQVIAPRQDCVSERDDDGVLVRETGADDAGGASRRLDAVGAQTGRIGCAYRAVPSSSA